VLGGGFDAREVPRDHLVDLLVLLDEDEQQVVGRFTDLGLRGGMGTLSSERRETSCGKL
jgi:hypothetical protein